MMRQYDEAKQACGDALLLFRMGDFYELFHEDAKIGAKELGLTLTSRDKGTNAIPMAGFPHHQLDGYLAKLIKRGFRVAVCEQVEDPKEAKGLVKREISQLVSPGTVTDQGLLDPSESNYLVAIVPPSFADKKSRTRFGDLYGVAWAELSSGRFFATGCMENQLTDLLARLAAKEILVPQSFLASLPKFDTVMITDRPDWSFAIDHATQLLCQQFGVATLDGFGLDRFGPAVVAAAGGIVEYIKETQRETLAHFDTIHAFVRNDHVEIDSATWRSLEVSRTIRTGNREGSLFDVIDRSTTPMGSRVLGEWLASPLSAQKDIESRHDVVEELVAESRSRGELRKFLGGVYDLQRLLARVATARTSPRDLNAVAKTLAAVPEIKARLVGLRSRLLQEMEVDLDLCEDLRNELEAALLETAPAQSKDGGFLREGYDAKLDELRQLATGGKQWIANYQQRICEETDIPSLKIGFNKVFGYYVEVTHTHRDKIPDNFIRKQTLKNAERFITPELKEYEEKVLAADSQALDRELEIFGQLRTLVQAHTARLKTNAEIMARLDCLAGLAELAVEQRYCRPQMRQDRTLEVVDGRHPVLDIIEPLGAFVPNDTVLEDGGFLHLITGPNMAGKSTYIRQVALITLLAQIGSFVPAERATIGIVDRIFARVGASDELTRGQSTFMVEMTETARILNTATDKSLVILDEIGRGTSTYDGVSLAWAIVEFLHDQIGCRALFATHYHELTELEQSLEGVKNFNVSVQEWQEKIVFLHKIVAGGADKSYGIQVAKLAGVPSWVNQRAEQILRQLEAKGEEDENREAIKAATGDRDQRPNASGQVQLTLFGPMSHPLVDKIKAMDADNLTPMGALELLHQWQHELAEEDVGTEKVEGRS